MGNILKKYNLTKGQWEVIGGAITGDTLPIGTEVDYDGTTIPNGWEEIDDVVVTENVVSRNIFNKNEAIIPNANIDADGAISSNASTFYQAKYISIKPNTKYTVSSANNAIYRIAEYDNSKTFIKRTYNADASTKYTIVTSSTTKFIRLAIDNSVNIDTIMFAEADDTDYAPYLNMLELEKKTSIITGKGTVNSDYISAVEYNHWERCGNIVSYSFTMTVNGVWDNTTKFISGLPKAKEAVRFLGAISWKDGDILLRLSVSKNGEIANSFSGKMPEKGNTIEGHITYITDEEATI